MNITFANGMRVITYFYDALSKWHDYDYSVLTAHEEECMLFS